MIVCYKNFVKEEMLTTKEVLEVLKKKGISISYPTIALWVREGKFEGAFQEETPFGSVWYIPEKTIKSLC